MTFFHFSDRIKSMKKELILEIVDPLKVSLKNDIFPAIKKGLSEDEYFVLRPIFLLENEKNNI